MAEQLREPLKSSWTRLITPFTFSRSGWSVARSASLAKGGTTKKRPSPHLHKVPTRNNLYIGCDEKYIEESINTKSHGLQIDNHLNWKNHVDLMIPKLSRGYYAVRSMPHVSSTDTLKSIYFAYFHSIMKY
jgi:hypothetical protein